MPGTANETIEIGFVEQLHVDFTGDAFGAHGFEQPVAVDVFGIGTNLFGRTASAQDAGEQDRQGSDADCFHMRWFRCAKIKGILSWGHE